MDAILLEIERSINLSPIWTVNPPTRVGSTCVWRTIVSFAPTLTETKKKQHERVRHTGDQILHDSAPNFARGKAGRTPVDAMWSTLRDAYLSDHATGTSPRVWRNFETDVPNRPKNVPRQLESRPWLAELYHAHRKKKE